MSDLKVLKLIKQRIEQSQKQGEVTQLELDSISIRTFTKEIKNMIQSYPKIQYMTVNDCQLISLNNFPYLPNLAILQLSHNQIQDDELFHLLKNSHISHLMIDQNQLKSIQKVSILRQLPNLQQLQIAGNRIGQSDFYRQELFDKIPHLKIIDCYDKYGNIAIESQSDDLQDCSMKKLNSDQSDQLQEQNKMPISKRQQHNILDLIMQEEQSLRNQSSKNEQIQQQAEEYKEQNNQDQTVIQIQKKIKPNQFSSN